MGYKLVRGFNIKESPVGFYEIVKGFNIKESLALWNGQRDYKLA